MARQHNLTIDMGTDVEFQISVYDDYGEIFDLTGHTARSKFRQHYQSANSVEFTATITDNKIVLSLDHVQTANLTPGRYYYDVEIQSSGNVVSRVLEGIVVVNPEMTY